MPSTLIVGSIGLDSISTPHGDVKEVLGGSASYGSIAASLFSDVSLVGIVGTDFPKKHLALLQSRGVDLSGLEVREGETFRWHGYYERDMGTAFTTTTALNVFEQFSPKLTEAQRRSPFVFLANIHPALQMHVFAQMESPKLVVVDTMNFWIEGSKAELTKVVKRADVMMINDQEARMFTETSNTIEAALAVRKMGPKAVIVKKGEHGALVVFPERIVAIPAFPVRKVKDPTGAGDTFAASMVGYLARLGKVTEDNLVRATQVGCVMASFAVEDFSVKRITKLTSEDIAERLAVVASMTSLPKVSSRTLALREPAAKKSGKKPA
ncbi:MAG: PfkB family carbohydrate kinase [Candidatus Sumerlaeia bacterium]|nr:PfkB family carbohydrate kinase [Candidatus Sumerlaeia bacterium]